MTDKHSRGTASQFFVASQLCRRGYTAVVTLGNCPNTDVLCSNAGGTKFVHIQVKTFRPGDRTCTVGRKAERDYGPRFFWILVGLPLDPTQPVEQSFVIPSKHMAKNIRESHHIFLASPGKQGQEHNDSNVRNVLLPPHKSRNGWSVKRFTNRWDLIDKKLTVPNKVSEDIDAGASNPQH